VAEFLRETRQRTQRQVLLEARIVEVTLGNDSQMGVDWRGLNSSSGNPSNSFFQTGGVSNSNVGAAQGLLQIVAQQGRVQATLSALARDNRLKVLSAPRLSTLNNQKAILRVVTEQAYALPSSQITPGTAAGGAVATGQVNPMIVPVGIILDILPEIGDDGYITLSVNPSISDVASEKAFSVPGADLRSPQSTVTLPVVNRRDMDAVVRIKSGETLVLAGMIMNKESTDNTGVPWLRNVPLIGALFAKNQKSLVRTELAIFITPTLMEEPEQIAAERRSTEKRLDTAGAELNPAPPPAKPELKKP
jgi:MSHA biogenesis protein MshL